MTFTRYGGHLLAPLAFSLLLSTQATAETQWLTAEEIQKAITEAGRARAALVEEVKAQPDGSRSAQMARGKLERIERGLAKAQQSLAEGDLRQAQMRAQKAQSDLARTSAVLQGGALVEPTSRERPSKPREQPSESQEQPSESQEQPSESQEPPPESREQPPESQEPTSKQ